MKYLKVNKSLAKRAFVLLVLFFINFVSARTYYVDKDNRFGNGARNDWPGTKEQPKRDFDGSWFKNNLQPGDTVIVREASSSYKAMSFETSEGSEGNPIVIMAYPGETIIFDNRKNSGPFAIKIASGLSNINLEGPFFISHKDKSLSVLGNCKNINFSNAKITNGGHGPRLEGLVNGVFKNLEISHLSANGLQCRGSISTHKGNPCRNLRFENIKVYDVDDGKHPSSSDADGFVSSAGDNLVFINCTTWGNREDGFDLASNSIMINCKAYDNVGSGLKVWRRSGDSYKEKTVTVINGVFANNGHHYDDTNPGVKVSRGAGLNLYNSVVSGGHDQGINIKVSKSDDPSGLNYLPVRVYNTIVTNTTNGAAIKDGGKSIGISILESDYNLYYGNVRVNDGFEIGDHSIISKDPLFVDEDHVDFKLEPGSPAINSGTNIAAFDSDYATHGMKDYEGKSRPAGGGFDIGAFESSGTLSSPNIDLEESITAYPNPTSTGVKVVVPSTVNDSKVSISVHNILGTMVSEELYEISNDQVYVPMNNLYKGVYFVKLSYENSKAIRIIKR